jgi:hypothetical protein
MTWVSMLTKGEYDSKMFKNRKDLIDKKQSITIMKNLA